MPGGISAALFARQGESHGRYIDCNLLGATAAFQGVNLVRAVFEGDRISLLEDSVTDAEGQRLGAYMEAHGDKLKPV